jgi:hypothetical protein
VSPKTNRVPKRTVKSSKTQSSRKGKKKDTRDPLGTLPGRPTLYKPEYCEAIKRYARKPEGHFRAFAAELGVSVETLHEWARVHPEFSEAKRVAKLLNEKAMVALGMKGIKGELRQGAWQNAWSFMMKARFGWREDGPDDQDDDADLEFLDG